MVCVGPLIPPCCGMLSLVVLVFFGPIPDISIVSLSLFGPRRCAWMAGTCVFRFDSDLVGSFHCWARSFWCTRSCYFCHRYRFRFRSALARIFAHSMDRNRKSPTEKVNSRVKSFRCNFFLLLVIVADYQAAQKLESVLRIVNGQLRLSVEHLSVGPSVPSKA